MNCFREYLSVHRRFTWIEEISAQTIRLDFQRTPDLGTGPSLLVYIEGSCHVVHLHCSPCLIALPEKPAGREIMPA